MAYDIDRMSKRLLYRCMVACVCAVGILLISFCPAAFGTAPYAVVHGPLQQIGSQSDWRAIVALWTNPELSAQLLPLTSFSLRSTDVQTLTCTRNC